MKFLLSLEKKKKKKKLFHVLTWDYNLLPSISLLGTQLKAIFSAQDNVFLPDFWTSRAKQISFDIKEKVKF